MRSVGARLGIDADYVGPHDKVYRALARDCAPLSKLRLDAFVVRPH